MVNKPLNRVLIFVGLALAHPALAASRGWVDVAPKLSPPEEATAVRGEIHDSNGQRYAIQNWNPPEVARWNGAKWETLPVQDDEWHPVALAPFGKGIACVSSQDLPQPSSGFAYRVSSFVGGKWHWLNPTPMRATYSNGSMENPEFLQSGNGLVLLVNRRDFFHVSLDRKVTPIFALNRSQMQRLGPPKEYSEQTNSLQYLDDKHGGYWFWTNVWEYGESAYSLRGLLHWDGQKLTHLTSLPGLSFANSCVDAVALHGDNNLWLALGKNGLFDVSSTTLQSRRVPEPAARAFFYVQQITTLNRDLFVVAFNRDEDREGDINQRAGQLWRQRGGHWQRLIEGLDRWPGDEVTRPILSNASGVWIPSAQGGVWLAQKNGPAVLLDWHYGLPMRTVSKIESGKDGFPLIAGWGAQDRIAKIVDVPALLAQRPTPRAKVFLSYLGLAQDHQGRIWTVLNLRDNALDEWNGTVWVKHRVPSQYKLSNANAVAFDRRGRVWIHSDNRDGQVAIYNPSATAGALWQVFPNCRLALVAQLTATPPALPQFYESTPGGRTEPSQTPDCFKKKLCYIDEWNIVHYFDGLKWLQWPIRRIDPHADTSEDFPVFFDKNGILSVNISSGTWKFGAQGWHRGTEWEDADRYSSVASNSASIPSGAFDSQHSSVQAVREPDKSYLVVYKGQLFHMTTDSVKPRLVAPIFDSKENHPFAEENTLEDAHFDKLGNAFILTGNSQYVFLRAPAPPETQATARTVGVDGIDITCASPSSGFHWFVWRRDGLAWSPPLIGSSIELRDFPGGPHKIEVAAIDSFFHRDPTPAILQLKINIDPKVQVEGFIADLASPEYARREKAVMGLAKQPEHALPALRAARSHADPDLQWWIDAAIQAAESSQ